MREFRPDKVNWGSASGRWIAVVVVAGFFVLFLAMGGFATVAAGHMGVKTRFGDVITGVLEPGLHFKMPFADTITEIEVREQKLEVDTGASSKDLQAVQAKIAVNFHPVPESVDTLYSKIGLDYKSRILDPAVEESVKAVTAQYTAEQLISKRTEVRTKMMDQLAERVQDNYIKITKFNIVNFEFSRSFNAAIEAKQTAEQEALRATNELRRIKVEADQKIEEARGRAESRKLEAQAEADAITFKAKADAERIKLQAEAESKAQELLAKTINQDVIRLRAIEKWDGILPRVTGDVVPFIDVEKATSGRRK
ncbi:MAG: prohibitin family protein [Planctomycetota bacterium]|jgi:regulator of protease activity HflC (stomatin/prohibitin superfamily)